MPRSNAALFAAALALMVALPASVGAVQAGAAGPAVTTTDLSLTLPAASGEQDPLPLGTGVDGLYDVELRNLGSSAADGQLTVTLPAGLELGPDGVVLFANASDYNDGLSSTISCGGVTGTVNCDVGSVPVTKVASDPRIVEIDVLASTGSTSGSTVGEPGTSVQLGVAIAPTTASDTNNANNTVSSTIDFTGVADLTYAITPVAPEVGVGKSTTLTLTVTNHGPQVAGSAFGFAAVQPNGHFSITSFDGPTSPPPNAPRAGLAARRSAVTNLARSGHSAQVRAAARAAAAGAQAPGGVFWFIGDLASGATATSHLVLTATTSGSSQTLLAAASDAADTGCVGPNDPCTPAFDTLTATPQTSAAYIASNRVKSAVYINGLVKQYAPAGVIRSAGRTVYLQRYLNGAWQNVLTRVTKSDGQLAVGFIQTQPYVYRLVVAASTTAATTTSGATIR